MGRTSINREERRRRRRKFSEGVKKSNFEASSEPISIANKNDADLREDSDWQDHHLGGRALRHHRECQGQDPRQGGHSPRSAEVDLCWQAVGRWSNSLRLQHSEGVNPPSCLASAWWHADFCQNLDW